MVFNRIGYRQWYRPDAAVQVVIFNIDEIEYTISQQTGKLMLQADCG
jgi:hypothetical protein